MVDVVWNTLWPCVVATLASSSVIDCLRHGSIFALTRARSESLMARVARLRHPSSKYPRRFRRRVRFLIIAAVFAELFGCPYCLSFHLPWLTLAWLGAATHAPAVYWWSLQATSLAVTRVVQLLNQLGPEACRFERQTKV